MKRQSQITGLILAGGRGRRFGRDKALAMLDGETYLQRSVAVLAPIVDEVIVVGRDAAPPELVGPRLVPDLLTGRGPLGGLYSGMLAARSDYVIAVACDLPLLNRALLAAMADLRHGVDVVMARLDAPEPLHAVYSRACLEPIRRRLDAGQFAMTAFLGDVTVRWLDRANVERLDPGCRSFFNVNTPDDAEQAARAAATTRG